MIDVRVEGLMRKCIVILLALMAAHTASAATLSLDQIQTVLKNSGFTNTGRPPIWHVEQEGDGTAVEPGGIAWWITVYYPPKALADDICVIDGDLLQVDDRLRLLIIKTRRKIALRSCDGIDFGEFEPLSSFDDSGIVRAVRVVQSLSRTGSAAGWLVKFSDAESRDAVSNLDQRRLYSIGNSIDYSGKPEIYLVFRTDACGQMLYFTLNEAAHTVRVNVDTIDVTDSQGHQVTPRCTH